jgi:Sec-independent protein secretion pathway component TatC
MDLPGALPLAASATTNLFAAREQMAFTLAFHIVLACIGVALPGVDPVTTIFETLPLAALYEVSIWLSALLDRRAARATAAFET